MLDISLCTLVNIKNVQKEDLFFKLKKKEDDVREEGRKANHSIICTGHIELKSVHYL